MIVFVRLELDVCMLLLYDMIGIWGWEMVIFFVEFLSVEVWGLIIFVGWGFWEGEIGWSFRLGKGVRIWVGGEMGVGFLLGGDVCYVVLLWLK